MLDDRPRLNSRMLPPEQVLVPYQDLSRHGVPFSRPHLNRMIKEGRFPKPVQLSERRIAWFLSQVLDWKRQLPVRP
jgi:prophage regulatory protein